MGHTIFNKALRILLETNGLILISAAMLGPIYALFVEKVGGDIFDASLTAGIFALAAGITTLVAGKFADKSKSPQKIVAFGYTMIGLGYFLYNFVNSIWFLFAIQILIGFSEALYSPAFDKVYSKHLSKKKAGREWGAWESTNYFSQASGMVIGGFVASTFGFNVLFTIMSAFCLTSAGIIWHAPKKIL